MSCSTDMAFFHSNFMLQTPQEDDHTHPSTSILPPSTPQDQFHGVASFLGKRSSSMLFSSGMEEIEMNININHGEDEFSDDGSQINGEKKRRLNLEQVKTLEKNFELGNKLEPERKMQLARALGLQPRQVAIWFQNRRARWKTKQLEKDYDILKRQFDALKAQNDRLQSHNHKLQAQIMALKTREPTESINLNKETEGSSSNRSENSSELIKLDMAIDSPNPNGPGLLPASSVNRPVAQLFQNSSRPENNNEGPKLEQSVKEESLSNMFCGMDDHTGFWPWLEQQNFN